MDKNPPANAGDTWFNPWSGKIPHASEHREPQLPSLWTAATEAHVPKAFGPQQESHCNEKPVHRKEE